MKPAPDLITAESVHQLFRTCWPDAGVIPDPFWAEQIAVALRAIRDRPEKRRSRLEALRYGRLFDLHARLLQVELQTEAVGYRHLAGGFSQTRC